MEQDAEPQVCSLKSRVLDAIGAVVSTVVFRRASADGTPVMALNLGDRVAAVPLTALQREFNISEASPDGKMFGLIAESLDFVGALRIGDALPSEVLTGEASWTAPPKFRELAASRLRLQLLAWADPSFVNGDRLDQAILSRMATDPELRASIQSAFDGAAAALALPKRDMVIDLVDEVAGDLGSIDALRTSLLRRVRAYAARLEVMSRGLHVDADRLTALTRVRGLSERGLQQISARFAEVDQRTGDVMTILRNVDGVRLLIRANRDWLYRTSRAWEPTLAGWEAAGTAVDEAAWARIAQNYQFLAPRYMPVKEWLAQSRLPQPGVRKLERVMSW